LGVEEVVRKVDIEIHNHASSRTFRNRQSIVKRGEGEITLLNVKPAVGFTLPSAGVTLHPVKSTNRKMARTPFCSQVLFPVSFSHLRVIQSGSCCSEESRVITSPAAGDGVVSRELGEVV
jgi:hypothetical protein